MKRVLNTLSSLTIILATVASANEPDEETVSLAGLPKTDFLAEYTVLFEKNLALNHEMFLRFDPSLVDIIDTETPITETELAAMSCAYDQLNESDQLIELAAQVRSVEILQEMSEEKPDMDYVDLTMNMEIVEGYTAGITNDVMSTLAGCGYTTASRDRMNLTPEFWTLFGAAAKERGYTD